ncbi:docking protein 1-like [Centruroides sculpturatus]|uniref:docking protein 1-like n=1 Tax=Centruroides sculpturatus TaxID=218467 RepID=UPI000C6DAED4|nr:docking protein 1-like [Centruroides sculpturatus]
MKLEAMEKEETFKTGPLFIPPQSFLRKNWHKKFCALYKASNHGIQRLEIFDNEDNFYRQTSYKIIPLTDCVKVTILPQKHQPNVFEVRTKSHTYQFSADTFQEMTDWLSALQTVSFGLSRQISLSSQTLDGGLEKRQCVVQHEENMLYSSVDTQVYGIKMIDTEASLRCGLQGEFYLVVTSVSISLAEEAAQGRIGKVVYTWPYRHIRRYGCSKDSFSFEAGRKCSSGEGLFCLISKDASAIFQNVDTHVNSLKASQSEIDLQASPSPSIDKSNAMFFNKQTFSGSQLSPLVRRKADDTDEKLRESSIIDEKVSSDDSKIKYDKMNSQEEDKRISSKPPFAKPPRKSKLKPENKSAHNSLEDTSINSLNRQSLSYYTSEHLYENPANIEKKMQTDILYDEPEERTEAWKTHGRNVEDNEIHPTQEEPEYAILEEMEIKQKNLISSLNEQLIQLQICSNEITNTAFSEHANDTDGYDHLALKRYQPTRFSNIPSNNYHVYGKLMTTTSSTNAPENSESDIAHYSNLPSLVNPIAKKEKSQELKQVSEIGDYENVIRNESKHTVAEQPYEATLHHFMQNDAEYAQVVKKK